MTNHRPTPAPPGLRRRRRRKRSEEAGLQPERPLDAVDLLALLGGDQRHDGAGAPGPARAARAVHVVHVVRRRIEVHDARKAVDMDSPRHDVGGDERVGLALGKGVERALALALGAVAVHGDGTHAVGLELPDDAVGAALGAAEDEGLPVMLDQLRP